jgi:UDP:flavonoid glycosyltransferase YjiC (YdhE family)
VIDAGGTVPPALSLGAELVRRGHQVRVLPDFYQLSRSRG